MSEAFSISSSMYSDSSPDSMQEEIQSRTGDESATVSIMRSIERFGRDESIQRYEIIPQPRARARHTAATSAWTVRAVRADPV